MDHVSRLRRTPVPALILWVLLVSPLTAAPPPTTLEVGTSAGCLYHTIAAAIAAAHPGDTIKVQNIVYTEGPLVITKNLTLAGGYNAAPAPACLTLTGLNHTTLRLTAGGTGRTLSVSNATVTVRWFIFENNTSGGALSVTDGALALEDTIVRNNSASWGAGLSVQRSRATLTDVEFNDNSATHGGGAIHIAGTGPSSTATLSHVTFRRNTAGTNGGAMHIEDGAQVMAQDHIALGIDGTTTNHAGQDGGGAYVNEAGSRLTITTGTLLSYVSSNTAGHHGGGLCAAGGGEIVLNGTLDPVFGERLIVSSNQADHDSDGLGNGGGIYAYLGSVYVARTLIFGNEARHGGGVYALNSQLEGSDVRIQHNATAGNGEGGGLWAGAESVVWLGDGSEIGGPDALDSNTAQEGGGLYATNAAVTVDGSRIEGNEGYLHGAGVCVTAGSHFTATHGTRIQENQTPYGCDEGGGIYADGYGTTVMIDASHVMSNTALSRGAGLYVGQNTTVTMRNSSTVCCGQTYAFEGGGAGAYLVDPTSQLIVDHSVVRTNWSAWHGGGIYNNGGTVRLEWATLYDNHTYGDGGGVYNVWGTVTGTGPWIGHNQALHGSGGGVYSSQGTVELARGGFYVNEATEGSGGGIRADHSRLVMARSKLTGNRSAGEGSAIYILGTNAAIDSPVELVNLFIADNETLPPLLQGPPGCCSTVYLENATARLVHNTFSRQVQAAFGVYAGNGSRVSLTNNIIVNYVVGIRRPAGGTGVATADYTLYYNNLADYDLAVSSLHNVYGDPKFVAPGDVAINATSAAINAGTNTGIRVDLDGDYRPLGLAYDLGADEYRLSAKIALPLVIRSE